MTSAAAALPYSAQEPEDALRSVLSRLAKEEDRAPKTAGSFEALGTLVAQTVRETVLPRTYALHADGHPGLCFFVSNRRLQALYGAGSAATEPLPDLPSSEVAEIVLKQLRSASEQASRWTLRLSDRHAAVIDGGGSCSAEILLSTLNRLVHPTLTASAPKMLARLAVSTGAGPTASEGDPKLIDTLERVAAAFVPSAFAPNVAGNVRPRCAIVVPLSDDHSVLITRLESSFVLQAFRAADISQVTQETGRTASPPGGGSRGWSRST